MNDLLFVVDLQFIIMLTFLISIAALIAGFFIYGKFVERFFGADDSRQTPAIATPDGVDYVPIPTWKVFTIEFLNIAGLGPIFGAVLGAMYGPMAYLWIVLGCIFMGAVHDYFAGMLSLRHNGGSIPEIVGTYLGNGARHALRVFTLLLLILVGVAFVSGPAGLLATLAGGGLTYWLIGIFVYYILATLLPINEIIGRIYPVFGAFLLIMAVAIGGAIIIKGATGSLMLQELTFDTFKNFHANPTENLLIPMLFIVVSCGAISGFHATQTPMMARCLKRESHGRHAFYGAMIAEGIVTMIWATAAMNYFGGVEGLNQIDAQGRDAAWIVNEICNSWLGKTGAVFAIIGVIVCPITTGDTAFRSARLTIADIFGIDQSNLRKRLLVTLPLFAVGYMMSTIKFATIWKYVGLSNQILSVIILWTAAAYLKRIARPHWLLSIPATFMTAVCVSYLLVAPYKTGGLSLDVQWGYWVGIGSSLLLLIWFARKK
jgi:carbon starvation protein CstA